MTREFTNLDAGEQRAVLYEKIDRIEKHLENQNGKVNTNCRDIHTIKIALIIACVILSAVMGLGIPSLPVW